MATASTGPKADVTEQILDSREPSHRVKCIACNESFLGESLLGDVHALQNSNQNGPQLLVLAEEAHSMYCHGCQKALWEEALYRHMQSASGHFEEFHLEDCKKEVDLLLLLEKWLGMEGTLDASLLAAVSLAVLYAQYLNGLRSKAVASPETFDWKMACSHLRWFCQPASTQDKAEVTKHLAALLVELDSVAARKLATVQKLLRPGEDEYTLGCFYSTDPFLNLEKAKAHFRQAHELGFSEARLKILPELVEEARELFTPQTSQECKELLENLRLEKVLQMTNLDQRMTTALLFAQYLKALLETSMAPNFDWATAHKKLSLLQPSVSSPHSAKLMAALLLEQQPDVKQPCVAVLSELLNDPKEAFYTLAGFYATVGLFPESARCYRQAAPRGRPEAFFSLVPKLMAKTLELFKRQEVQECRMHLEELGALGESQLPEQHGLHTSLQLRATEAFLFGLYVERLLQKVEAQSVDVLEAQRILKSLPSSSEAAAQHLAALLWEMVPEQDVAVAQGETQASAPTGIATVSHRLQFHHRPDLAQKLPAVADLLKLHLGDMKARYILGCFYSEKVQCGEADKHLEWAWCHGHLLGQHGDWEWGSLSKKKDRSNEELWISDVGFKLAAAVLHAPFANSSAPAALAHHAKVLTLHFLAHMHWLFDTGLKRGKRAYFRETVLWQSAAAALRAKGKGERHDKGAHYRRRENRKEWALMPEIERFFLKDPSEKIPLDQKIKLLKVLVGTMPPLSHVVILLGWAFQAAGDSKKAEACYQKASRTRVGAWPAGMSLAHLRGESGNKGSWAEGINHLKDLQSWSPNKDIASSIKRFFSDKAQLLPSNDGSCVPASAKQNPMEEDGMAPLSRETVAQGSVISSKSAIPGSAEGFCDAGSLMQFLHDAQPMHCLPDIEVPKNSVPSSSWSLKKWELTVRVSSEQYHVGLELEMRHQTGELYKDQERLLRRDLLPVLETLNVCSGFKAEPEADAAGLPERLDGELETERAEGAESERGLAEGEMLYLLVFSCHTEEQRKRLHDGQEPQELAQCRQALKTTGCPFQLQNEVNNKVTVFVHPSQYALACRLVAEHPYANKPRYVVVNASLRPLVLESLRGCARQAGKLVRQVPLGFAPIPAESQERPLRILREDGVEIVNSNTFMQVQRICGDERVVHSTGTASNPRCRQADLVAMGLSEDGDLPSLGRSESGDSQTGTSTVHVNSKHTGMPGGHRNSPSVHDDPVNQLSGCHQPASKDLEAHEAEIT